MGAIQSAIGATVGAVAGAAVAGKHLKQQGESVKEAKELKEQALEQEKINTPVEIAKLESEKANLESTKAKEEAKTARKEAEAALKKLESPAVNKFMAKDPNLVSPAELDRMEKLANKTETALQNKTEAKKKERMTTLEAAKKARQVRDLEIKAITETIKMKEARFNKLTGGEK